ncbi:MAG: HD domain-containing protein [Firmicutes bacterium]|nr:HD domain-containing protein [Bacillota bacterium]
MKNKESKKQIKVFLFSLLLNLIFYRIIYFTGGTTYPFPHLFYIVIAFAALCGNWFNTLFTSIMSSVLVSYWLMPLNIEKQISQGYFPWIFRSLIFISIGVIIKISVDLMRRRNNLLTKKSDQLYKFQESTFRAILNLSETKDPETTGNHLERMTAYAKVLLKDINMPADDKEDIILGMSFHDIGKVGIPDEVLLKPDKLTSQEYEIMKEHTVIGGEIIELIKKSVINTEEELLNRVQVIKDLVYYHHERPDGKGYPKGLKGDEIPFAAKVTSICDVYDALSSKRPYKEPLPHKKCVEIIKKGKGTQFDKNLVEEFLKVHNEFKEIANNLIANNNTKNEKLMQSIEKINSIKSNSIT